MFTKLFWNASILALALCVFPIRIYATTPEYVLGQLLSQSTEPTVLQQYGLTDDYGKACTNFENGLVTHLPSRESNAPDAIEI